MEKTNTHSPPSPETIPQFKDTPWALNLFSNPELIPYDNESRRKKDLRDTTGDTFVSRTLATGDTISGWQSFMRFGKRDGKGKEGGDGKGRTEIWTVMRIGGGVNGHRDICHGGFVGLLLDEVIGSAAEMERDRSNSTMTAYLKVDYKAPIRTPGVVLCKSWLEKKEGRKMWGKGTVEDGEGGILAVGEALFLTVGKEKVGLVPAKL